MELTDKILILVSNFQKKHGYKPTFVLLPEAQDGKLLGLVVKIGDKLAVGLGSKLLFWNDDWKPQTQEIVLPKAPPTFAQAFAAYERKQGSLADVLNAIVDFETNERTKLCK